ncbi:MAG: phage tail protein [Nitrosomonas sp.]|jgi:microcystin-dependent protein|nr:phage tail protein [Nitrosomonas sp.]MBP7112995.1 phage tail protein [Nitrosomonas sp.]
MRHIKKSPYFLSFTVALALLATTPGSATAGLEPFVGEISYVAFDYAPNGWFKCDGQTLPISQYAALYSLLGTKYGGDGITNFKLPDMRGKVPVHQGQSPGYSNFTMGQTNGAENFTLTATQLPTHSHPATAVSTSTSAVAPGASATSTLKAANVAGDMTTPGSNAIATSSAALTKIYSSTTAPNVNMHIDSIETTLSGVNVTTTTNTAVTVGDTGSSQPFSIMQPYTTVNCIIAWQGVYPSRP